jgi:hypothetical protein
MRAAGRRGRGRKRAVPLGRSLINDSGWRVFSGDETQEYADDAQNFAMYNASTILAIDPSIGTLLATPAPVAFERDVSGKFVKGPRPSGD